MSHVTGRAVVAVPAGRSVVPVALLLSQEHIHSAPCYGLCFPRVVKEREKNVRHLFFFWGVGAILDCFFFAPSERLLALCAAADYP